MNFQTLMLTKLQNSTTVSSTTNRKVLIFKLHGHFTCMLSCVKVSDKELKEIMGNNQVGKCDKSTWYGQPVHNEINYWVYSTHSSLTPSLLFCVFRPVQHKCLCAFNACVVASCEGTLQSIRQPHKHTHKPLYSSVQ